jgi:hypothetical protein
MQPNKFDRNSAFTLKVQDPDNSEDKTAIIEMVTVDKELLIFKTSAIYRGLTADTIDPQNQYPDTRHSHEKIYSVGASNSYVARMILQFKKILELVFQDEVLKERLLKHVWKANKLLLECENSQYAIYKSTRQLLSKCDEIMESNKTKQTIPALPKVEDLKNHVEHFLNYGKLFLVSTFEILHIIYQMPFTDQTGTHFNKHCKWARKKFGENDPIYALLDQDKGWIRILSEMRNAIQHPDAGYIVEIENIAIKPGNRFSSPAWRYDLTKKGLGRQEEYFDLVPELDVHLSNLLTFFEELLVLCAIKELDAKRSLLTVCRKKKEDIRPECPIVYVVNKRWTETCHTVNIGSGVSK